MDWLAEQTPEGGVVAVDGAVMAVASARTLGGKLAERGARLRTDIDRGPGLARDQESERDIMLSYVVQSGPLKDLAFDLKNMRTQQQYGNDYNEYRLITSYTWKFW